MTVTEIAEEHGVSRQTIHTYRRTGVFPSPVEGEGSTRRRFREDEVAAFFKANPKQPRKKRRFPPEQQGEPVTTTVDPRLALMSRLNTPPYDDAAGTYSTPLGEAAQLLDAYRAAVITEVEDALTAKGAEFSELAEEQGRPSLEERAQEWYSAAETAAKLKSLKGEPRP